MARNREALDAVRLLPRVASEEVNPVLATRLLDQDFAAPFGIAPIGLTGLMWPGGERILARTARAQGIPYGFSCVACDTPEDTGALAGERGWFQLYPARDRQVRDDLIRRARDSGFNTLLLTVDVPVYAVRERQRRAGLTLPARTRALTILQGLACPAYSAAVMRHGLPRFRTIAKYAAEPSTAAAATYALTQMNAPVDERYFSEVREQWPGPLLVKGVLHPDDAAEAMRRGADGIVVSNHGGRQFDAAPAPIEMLPAIRAAVGPHVPILMDGGIEGGLDIIRAIALGADFVLLGRAFLYGLGALGEAGGVHVCNLLTQDLRINMKQLAAGSVAELKGARARVVAGVTGQPASVTVQGA